jgi:hypothetical protein
MAEMLTPIWNSKPCFVSAEERLMMPLLQMKILCRFPCVFGSRINAFHHTSSSGQVKDRTSRPLVSTVWFLTCCRNLCHLSDESVSAAVVCGIIRRDTRAPSAIYTDLQVESSSNDRDTSVIPFGILLEVPSRLGSVLPLRVIFLVSLDLSHSSTLCVLLCGSEPV